MFCNLHKYDYGSSLLFLKHIFSLGFQVSRGEGRFIHNAVTLQSTVFQAHMETWKWGLL